MNQDQIQEVGRITQKIYEDFCHGNTELWFNTLHKNCVWVAHGEPTLIGAKQIKEYFSNYPINAPVEIINQSYSTLALNSSSYIVTGDVLVGTDAKTPTATVLMTLVYRYSKNIPKLVYQNMSYDFLRNDLTASNSGSKNSYTDLATKLMLRQTLLCKEDIVPIKVKVGQQIYYIPPASIIYLQSNRHKTCIYLIDKVIECSMLITEIEPQLPDYFYFLRRGCIINTMFVTAIRRCEIELIFGTTIQIPAPTFTTAKKEINDLIMRSKIPQ